MKKMYRFLACILTATLAFSSYSPAYVLAGEIEEAEAVTEELSLTEEPAEPETAA